MALKRNRSIPDASVIPVLIYADVRAAVAWLSDAFGFSERVRIGEDHRSQLAFDGGAVIVGDVRGDRRPPRAGEVTHSVTVRVEDAHAHCERAREHGAKILMEPTDMPYGERQYNAEDPAGHQWTFSQTLADVAPEEWGGISLDRVQLARDVYAAYESGDRGAIEDLIAEDFTFSSPADVGIDRARYFERCWPNAGAIEGFEFVRLVEADDEVIVTYESTKTDGRRFRNTEVLTFAGAKLCKAEVYFGWNL